MRRAIDPLCNRNLMPVRVRADSDLSSCVRIAEEVHRLDGYPVYLPTDLRQFLASSDALSAWVAEEHGDILGHVALHQRSSDSVLALASETLHHPADQFGVIARLLVAPRRDERASGGCSSRQPRRIHYVVAFGRSSMW